MSILVDDFGCIVLMFIFYGFIGCSNENLGYFDFYSVGLLCDGEGVIKEIVLLLGNKVVLFIFGFEDIDDFIIDGWKM